MTRIFFTNDTNVSVQLVRIYLWHQCFDYAFFTNSDLSAIEPKPSILQSIL